MRHVPSFDYVVRGGDSPFFTEEEYAAYKGSKGPPTINASVQFEWSDVRYIIVKENAQIDRMITDLDSFGCNNKRIGVFCG